ncbi:hypothetical protein [Pelagicoccus mobilis]|uniref:Uncharacterized protein n=1 Tax=Pelagicoccus mobilis TaxID=415221 RepID=A0A934S576_9BACT|nr:hypothetical protein [Pelagicoccus mobilis]MBK1879609.1 hypothetical protein [Pelagicoccus mobilis]
MKNELNKDTFVQILRDCGLSDAQMTKLHQLMEKRFPESHQRFLEFLQIGDDEIAAIRQS